MTRRDTRDAVDLRTLAGTYDPFGADHDHERVVVLPDRRVHGVGVSRVLHPAIVSVAGVLVQRVT